MPQFESEWCLQYAEVAEQADAQDLKSCGSDTVPVRFRSSAPKEIKFILGFFLFDRNILDVIKFIIEIWRKYYVKNN